MGYKVIVKARGVESTLEARKRLSQEVSLVLRFKQRRILKKCGAPQAEETSVKALRQE